MPTSNVDHDTALSIGPGTPISLVQDIGDLPSPWEVWYKWTPTFTGVAGIWFHAPLASNYRPLLYIKEDDGSAYLDNSQFNGITGKPAQIPVVLGHIIYFKVIHDITSGFTPTTPIISGSVTRGTMVTAIASGSLIVNDDTGGFPAAVVTAAGFQGFIHPFPAGELGSQLPDGTLVIQDIDQRDGLIIYDKNLVETVFIPNATLPTTGIGGNITDNRLDMFYVPHSGSAGIVNAKVTKLSKAGVVGAITTLPDVGLIGIAVSPDETILYHTGQGGINNAPVKRWDLIGDIAMTDLIAAPNPGGDLYRANKDILSFPDGSIVVSWQKTTSNWQSLLYHVAANGSILHTATFSNTVTIDSKIEHLAHANDGGATFWVWYQKDGALGKHTLQRIRLSDFVVVETATSYEFESGVYTGADWPDDTGTVPRFGESHSCPFWSAQQSAFLTESSEPGSGDTETPPVATAQECCVDKPLGDTPIPDETEPPTDWVAQCDGDGLVPVGGQGIPGDDIWV